MPERVLLIDVDSTIPNLALMRLSTYWKQKGAEVGFNIPDPTKVYASCIFKWNAHKTDGLGVFYPDAEINIGGSGIDLSLSRTRLTARFPTTPSILSGSPTSA